MNSIFKSASTANFQSRPGDNSNEVKKNDQRDLELDSEIKEETFESNDIENIFQTDKHFDEDSSDKREIDENGEEEILHEELEPLTSDDGPERREQPSEKETLQLSDEKGYDLEDSESRSSDKKSDASKSKEIRKRIQAPSPEKESSVEKQERSDSKSKSSEKKLVKRGKSHEKTNILPMESKFPIRRGFPPRRIVGGFRRLPGGMFNPIKRPFQRPFGAPAVALRRMEVERSIREREMRQLKEVERRRRERREEEMRVQREQKEFEKKQRDIRKRIEREKEKLRFEREKLEKEKLELLRLEQQTAKVERERLEREREELKWRQSQLPMSHRIDEPRGRPPVIPGPKRPYESHWEDRKRINTQRFENAMASRAPNFGEGGNSR